MPKLHKNAIDLTGQRFGRLRVIALAGRDKWSKTMWKCQCDCGKITTVRSTNLKSGNTKSCGCIFTEKLTKHGMCGTSEYNSWEHIVQRCTNPKSDRYKYYGGRGIVVCERWRDFRNFFKDMGKKPDSNFSIERRNNNEGYYPENCYWATQTTQVRNTRLLIKSATGAKGVYIRKNNKKKYIAAITVKRKSIHLGAFNSIKEAVTAREKAEIKYWGKQ